MKEIDLLANYIMSEIEGEPSQSEGAGMTAVRLLREYRSAMEQALLELGVPNEDYPAPVANAVEILRRAYD